MFKLFRKIKIHSLLINLRISLALSEVMNCAFGFAALKISKNLELKEKISIKFKKSLQIVDVFFHQKYLEFDLKCGCEYDSRWLK